MEDAERHILVEQGWRFGLKFGSNHDEIKCIEYADKNSIPFQGHRRVILFKTEEDARRVKDNIRVVKDIEIIDLCS